MKKLIFILFVIIVPIAVSCKRSPDLGGGYQLGYNSMNDISIVKILKKGDAPTIFIYGHVLDYAFDSTFIIASERPRDSVIGIKNMTQSKYQEVFEQSTFKHYWVINKKEPIVYSLDTLTQRAKYSNVYGPFKKKEYLLKRKELGVPSKLKLKE